MTFYFSPLCFRLAEHVGSIGRRPKRKQRFIFLHSPTLIPLHSFQPQFARCRDRSWLLAKGAVKTNPPRQAEKEQKTNKKKKSSIAFARFPAVRLAPSLPPCLFNPPDCGGLTPAELQPAPLLEQSSRIRRIEGIPPYLAPDLPGPVPPLQTTCAIYRGGRLCSRTANLPVASCGHLSLRQRQQLAKRVAAPRCEPPESPRRATLQLARHRRRAAQGPR